VNTIQTSFDDWHPVQSNNVLPGILAALPGSPTLDSLFGLPLQRLHYYQKLYSKLLKSTQPGRSDHRLLMGANEKLDGLVAKGEASIQRRVGTDHEHYGRPQSGPAHSEPADSDGQTERDKDSFSFDPPVLTVIEGRERDSEPPSTTESLDRLSERFSSISTGTADTSLGGNGALPTPEDLERRLDTSRTLDIFTMTPKVRVAVFLRWPI
jgi:hypothetical protein